MGFFVRALLLAVFALATAKCGFSAKLSNTANNTRRPGGSRGPHRHGCAPGR